jgi:hypothetical protein
MIAEDSCSLARLASERPTIQVDEASPAPTPGQSGAYGLRIEGLEPAAGWMQPLPAGSPRLRVQVLTAAAGAGPSELTPAVADLRLVGHGRLLMHRGDDRVSFTFATPPLAPDLLHPYLAPAAALAQLWAGHEALHAGAFATPAGAVLVLGGKEQGKSTTLAALARRHGVPIIADDLAVIAHGSVLAGPRCIDLRSPAAVDPALSDGAQPVRGADRFRLTLPAAPPAAPIAAVVSLGWGQRIELGSVAPARRLPELLVQRMFGALVPVDHQALLGLAALPMMKLLRPRGRSGLGGAADVLARYLS